jgi:hypothetical protein
MVELFIPLKLLQIRTKCPRKECLLDKCLWALLAPERQKFFYLYNYISLQGGFLDFFNPFPNDKKSSQATMKTLNTFIFSSTQNKLPSVNDPSREI